jgi:hypothetical protein
VPKHSKPKPKLTLLLPSLLLLLMSPPQTNQEAIKFYTGKVSDLGRNLTELERVIGGKSENVRVVEDGELETPSPTQSISTDPSTHLLFIIYLKLVT